LHDLTILAPAAAGLTTADALTALETEAVLEFAQAAKSRASLRAYASDWQDFRAWCAARGATALPATPALVCGYISTLAHGGLKASTLGRRIAAIAHVHSQHGHKPPPTADETVRVVMKGIRRTIGTAPDKKTPATHDILGQMLDACPDTLIGKRDRALLALGFAGAFRRSELVALNVTDLIEVADGLRVVIRHSKTDQEGQGAEIAIPRGYRLRPVEAVQTWLAAAEISAGPVFRSVALGCRIGTVALSPYAASLVIKQRIAAIGLDPATYSGHSLRSGFLTSAAEAGASLFKLTVVSRHKSLDTLRGHVRRVDLFKEHAGAAFL
jgi:site-specific recombinase XerD